MSPETTRSCNKHKVSYRKLLAKENQSWHSCPIRHQTFYNSQGCHLLSGKTSHTSFVSSLWQNSTISLPSTSMLPYRKKWTTRLGWSWPFSSFPYTMYTFVWIESPLPRFTTLCPLPWITKYQGQALAKCCQSI